ncbi:hypothetical protein [Brevifollis gellanilyticus]|uniref:Uncharacterized protein n=1 Tax=Brevifollis gellanilyticus TaxID=748831 RepID=A0A512M894_9BACT|nr:hypothetical protein [Brevifollis gellanilyticus]GEP42958.1 hypothetical protein BGE01nite_22490 [Brevifollis gellanilyticus]
MNPPPAESAPYWLPFAIVGGFLIVFPTIWCFVVWLLSHMGGWQALTPRYASGSRPVAGTRHSGLTGMVGGVSYRSTLTAHLDTDGFFIEVMPLFKIGHPRLFIPWPDISDRKQRQVLWWKAEVLSIGQPVITTIALPSALLEAQDLSAGRAA